ncbi:hypothetical protein H112_05641 [Trichophyton rubrum D6]|uniref:Uncharacterized protein n=3 Tax=Trichophyton TaxID=5550 RepID=A0A080WSJ3_TRIRC|nr:uncharacterized protein TERG_11989 [Trichophyton rubrum CBS 118892]EZF16642.1 hypothetical protein H100_05660 [Trichophyton rubrum MR850]EZF40322.1 hypothetical protein H102_05628 [Trichophyton rubrum CBS 100081]EZF50827.1 hypothetical protein H103_05655 [Trichophyton rubrum CBS 288.86]EZF61545.1 hypothetical protein H104_05640 [Trichophyton rubrum CBS 289.86]EZF72308.1 hypothetical protein H105_05668 [Trichophyton soudanense CBS 452.61]EZF82967.1 hypothetical protein H110_05650 [Trichophy
MLSAFLTAAMLDLHIFSHHLLPALSKFWRRLLKREDSIRHIRVSCYTPYIHSEACRGGSNCPRASSVRGLCRVTRPVAPAVLGKIPVHEYVNGAVSVRLYFPKQNTPSTPSRLSPTLEPGKYKVVFLLLRHGRPRF